MEKMCRTCLRTGENQMLDLTEDQSLVSKIEVISSIQISLTDDYPKVICEECADNVNKFFCFRKIIINSDKEMRDQHDQLKQRHIKIEQEKTEIKHPIRISRLRKKRIKTIASEENNENSDDYNRNKDGQDHKDDNSSHNLNIGENTDDASCDMTYIKYGDDDSDNIPYDIEDDEHRRELDSPNTKYRKNKKKIYHCEKCNITFPSRSRLYSHKRGLHTTPAICNYCGVVIRSDNLKKHMQRHLEHPVTCKVCSKVFKNSESLRGHMILHRGLTFECQICARVFKIKSEYHRHVKCHADPNIRKVMCSVCGKRVRDMKKHLLTHTGERPYLCTHCNKGFTSTYALKIHSRQHTKERPFICEYCSLSFAQKVSLITHLKNKHGNSGN